MPSQKSEANPIETEKVSHPRVAVRYTLLRQANKEAAPDWGAGAMGFLGHASPYGRRGHE